MRRSALLLAAAAAAACALSLAGCETATPYQPLNARGSQASGGYSERQVEANRYIVRFAGNSLTSRETVERYLLLRSAELTLQSGYDWFTTVDRHTDRDTRYFTTPDPFYSGWGGYWGPRWGFYGPRYGAWRYGYWGPRGWGDPFGPDFDIHAVTQYEASAEIVMGKGPKPASDPRAFDARAVQEHLAGTVQRPNV
jgi:hypothetical protein